MNKIDILKEIKKTKQHQIAVYDYLETIKNSDRVINTIKAKIKNAKKPIMIVLIEQD